MSTLSKKKLAKKDLFKIKIRYNKDIKRKGALIKLLCCMF